MPTPERIGRYEVIRPIASGGMATVHLGRVVRAGGFQRVVAIKVMHPHIASDPDFVAMFLDEARLAAGIRHPNVVATLDVEQAAEGLFLVMEYVDGLAVHHLANSFRKRGAPFPIPAALRIVLDMLAGLHAAHELIAADGRPLGLVHRDVSPQNILVGSDGIARLTDFGVARAEARISSTRGSQVKGKVPYMSPEQLDGETVDRRSDIWATGVVIWELLAGKRLFQASSDGALVAAVMKGAVSPPSAFRRDVPSAIDQVCMMALAPLARRVTSAATLAEAIEDAAASSGIAIATPRVVGKLVLDEMSKLGVAPLPATLAGAGEVPEEFKSSPFAAKSLPLAAPSSPLGASPPPHLNVDDQAETIAVESGSIRREMVPAAGLPVAGSGASQVAAVLSQRPRSRTFGLGALAAGLALLLGLATAVLVFVNVRSRAVTGAPATVVTLVPSAGSQRDSGPPAPAATELTASSAASAAPMSSSVAPAPTAVAPAPTTRVRPKGGSIKPKGGGEFQPGRL